MIRPLRTLRTYRRLRRYRQVTFTLAKYGFGDIADRIGVHSVFRPYRRRSSRSRIPTAQRLRLALADLGPTFVKFGQLLSTRPDILPERYVAELARLQDQVSPFPLEEVRQIIREELGQGPETLFARFDEEPLASGSIAQVHRAALSDGTEVAVKVQRPGIFRLIETDLSILEELTDLLQKYVPELRVFRPRRLVDQFAKTIRRELDFVAEAQAIERFRKNAENDPSRFIPRVHWDYSSLRVLTTDFVDGVKITDVEGIKALGLDPKEVAKLGARAILREVFEHRLFHADPHPGNFFVLPGNVIATVDYGIVGRLDDETTDLLGRLLTAVITRDVNGIMRVFGSLGMLNEEVDSTALRFDIQEFLDRYYGLPLDRIDAEKVIADILVVVRRHQIILPVNLALLGKMITLAAGVGRMLDPRFDILSEAKPFVRMVLSQRFDPRRKLKQLARTLDEYQGILSDLPADLKEIVGKLKKGKIVVALHHEGLSRLILEIDRSSNRLSFGMIIAALIIGSSLVMTLNKGPSLFGFPALGLGGYLVAGLLGLWLVVAILRSGRI